LANAEYAYHTFPIDHILPLPSVETKDFLDKVVENLNYQLQQYSCIKQNLRGIKFSDFSSNQKRTEFLTSFKEMNYSPS